MYKSNISIVEFNEIIVKPVPEYLYKIQRSIILNYLNLALKTLLPPINHSNNTLMTLPVLVK